MSDSLAQFTSAGASGAAGRGLAGTRGLLIDLDGVLTLRGEPIPGSVEAVECLNVARFPYVVATNMSIWSRESLSAGLARIGFAIAPERLLTAAFAAASWCREHVSGEPLYVMAAPDAMAEFHGLRLVGHEQAAAPDARVAAVVVGDAGDDFTAANMQAAFRLVRGGARLVAMHRNRWWFTPAGPTLDSGAYVAALEYGTESRALVCGKPARTFFRTGAAMLGGLGRRAGAGASPIAAGDAAMVGDDLWHDVGAAQGAGLRGFLVRSGKHGQAELARLAARPSGRPADLVAENLLEIVLELEAGGALRPSVPG